MEVIIGYVNWKIFLKKDGKEIRFLLGNEYIYIFIFKLESFKEDDEVNKYIVFRNEDNKDKKL